MMIEGQVHGGLTEALAIAMGQEIAYDEIGNVVGAAVHGLLPADGGRDAELGDRLHGDALAASSDRRQGVGESPNVGGVPAFSNAVNDAFAHLGSTHTACRTTNWRVWQAAERLGLHG